MSKDSSNETDQAAELRKLIGEVESNQDNLNNEPSTIPKQREKEQEVDILNLPPRKEIHSNSNTPFKLKINKSIIRLLFIILIVLAVILGVILLNEHNVIDFNAYFKG